MQAGHARGQGHSPLILDYGTYSKSLEKESLSLSLKLSILLRDFQSTLHVDTALKF